MATAMVGARPPLDIISKLFYVCHSEYSLHHQQDCRAVQSRFLPYSREKAGGGLILRLRCGPERGF